MENLLQTLSIIALPVIFAITLHEAAHGYAAKLLGDTTAERMGRISLNPMRHIDPVGTLLVPAMILLISTLTAGTGLLFGWAKPVPINFAQLRHPKRDMLWVALAGPGANLVMAIAWAAWLKLQFVWGFEEIFFIDMAKVGITINLVLMALNLFPLPPLDGGRVMFSLLPHRLAWQYGKIEPYGMMIVLALFFFNLLSVFINPLVSGGFQLMQFLFGFQ